MWMLEGCAALVHSGVDVLIITPQRPSKKDFCSIYLIDPGVSPHNSVCFYRQLPPPFPDPSVSQLFIISMCIIVVITCQGEKEKKIISYVSWFREKTWFVARCEEVCSLEGIGAASKEVAYMLRGSTQSCQPWILHRQRWTGSCWILIKVSRFQKTKPKIKMDQSSE